jgi:CrcB protein
VLNKLILVFFGGAVGAAARELAVMIGHQFHGHFPTAILTVNLVAAFLIGLVTELAVENGPINQDVKLFTNTGMMGGLSTFSTLIWGTLILWGEPGQRLLGGVYLVIGVVAGLVLVELGLRLGRSMTSRPAE